MAGFTIISKRKTARKNPAGVVIHKAKKPEKRESKATTVKEARFNGPLIERPIQFPDDVEWMTKHLLRMGLDVSPKDVQALGHKLSVDFYPWSNVPEVAWLTAGRMASLLTEHALDYLIVYD